MDITVIGTGYVGLVSGTCFADAGHNVCCFDTDKVKIDGLKRNILPIYEPDLDALVKKNFSAGRLHFTTDVQQSVNFGEVQIIAVGTPPDEQGCADLKYVMQAAENIGRYMVDEKVIINKSTVPVGTAQKIKSKIQEMLAQRNTLISFKMASNPEFLREGLAIDDFKFPDRIIIGVDDRHTLESMHRLYAPFNHTRDKFIFMDLRSAELTKYAANGMLATRISFMNELANLAEKLEADIEHVRLGLGSDRRIGSDFLFPGIGYGGSCFPKDVKALIKTANDQQHQLTILNAVDYINEKQKYKLVDKILEKYGDNLSNYCFAIWGLAFKPDTDDMREAPSKIIIQELSKRGAKIQAFDPVSIQEAQKVISSDSNIIFARNKLDALEGADGLLIITEWSEFKDPDFNEIKNKLKAPVIFDGRNIYDPIYLKSIGIEYHCIGRPVNNKLNTYSQIYNYSMTD